MFDDLFPFYYIRLVLLTIFGNDIKRMYPAFKTHLQQQADSYVLKPCQDTCYDILCGYILILSGEPTTFIIGVFHVN